MFKLRYSFIALAAAGLVACQTTPMAQSGSAPASGLRTTSVDYIGGNAQGGDLPPAKVGECYARVVTPATYADSTEQVLKKGASTKIDVVPATFATGTETILVKPATTKLEIVPATYGTEEETVLVKAASTRLETIPATYKTATEQKLVKGASTLWKRSSELSASERAAQNIDSAAGDVLCLVEVPAEYTTVTSQVLDQPASTREVAVPAEYAKVTKTVLKTPETTREVTIPAEYKTIEVTKVATPAREVVTEIPAEYETITSRAVKSAGSSEWRQILCQTNATPAKLGEVQSALTAKGYPTGRTDGVIDAGTLAAVRSYQTANNLPVDGDRYINIQTVRALGLDDK